MMPAFRLTSRKPGRNGNGAVLRGGPAALFYWYLSRVRWGCWYLSIPFARYIGM